MNSAHLTQWLREPLVTGRLALLCGIFALAVPTTIRWAANGVITGCEFTPYLPFILISAIMLTWWQAGLVALGAVAILGGLFSSSLTESLERSCFISGAGIFLASSAIMIGVAIMAKEAIAGAARGRSERTLSGLVLSLEAGEVWASWYGSGPPVRLGSQRWVCETMEDFLAQVELGKRLGGYDLPER